MARVKRYFTDYNESVAHAEKLKIGLLPSPVRPKDGRTASLASPGLCSPGILWWWLWGALVRVTGSGAGCGNHWPLCNGQFTPNPTSATIIEYTHRAMTGLDSALVLALVVWAFRVFPHRHPARLGAALSVVFLG